MSKFALTINSDDPADIARIMAAIGGASGAVAYATAGLATALQPTAEADEGAVNTAAPATDSSGLPWDDRIHASTKALKADGTWRGKRNVSDTLVASVTAELRSRGGVAPIQQQQPVAPVAVAPVQPAPQPVQPPQYDPAQYAQPQPVQYAQPAAPAPVQYAQPVQQPVQPPQYDPAQYAQPQPVAPVAPVAAAPIDFGAFMGGVQRAMTTVNPATGVPFADQAYISGFVGRLSQALQRQLNAITDIHADPAAIAVAVQMLQAEGRWI